MTNWVASFFKHKFVCLGLRNVALSNHRSRPQVYFKESHCKPTCLGVLTAANQKPAQILRLNYVTPLAFDIRFVTEHSRYFRNFAISLFRKTFKYTTFSFFFFFCTCTLSHLIADKLYPTCRRNSFLLKADRSFYFENNYNLGDDDLPNSFLKFDVRGKKTGKYQFQSNLCCRPLDCGKRLA